MPLPGTAAGIPAGPPPSLAGVVLYTACFGGRPAPAPLLQEVPGLRCLLLSDRDLAVAGWDTVAIPAPDPDPERALLRACLLGEALLAEIVPDTTASLWIDPGVRVIGNLRTLLERWLLPQDIALWRHGAARDWAEVVETAVTGIVPPAFLAPGRAPAPASSSSSSSALLSSALLSPAFPSPAFPTSGPAFPACPSAGLRPLLALADAALAAGLPRGTGAGDPRAIWRRHGDPAIAALMAAWWDGAAAAPATAETLLALLMAESCRAESEAAAGWARPKILPAAPAAAPDGLFLAAAPWPQAKRRADPARGRRLRIAFLYDEAFAGSASTFLRGGQLAELVAEELPGRYDIAWTTDAAGTEGSLVVLTKWALQMRSPRRSPRSAPATSRWSASGTTSFPTKGGWRRSTPPCRSPMPRPWSSPAASRAPPPSTCPTTSTG